MKIIKKSPHKHTSVTNIQVFVLSIFICKQNTHCSITIFYEEFRNVYNNGPKMKTVYDHPNEQKVLQQKRTMYFFG